MRTPLTTDDQAAEDKAANAEPTDGGVTDELSAEPVGPPPPVPPSRLDRVRAFLLRHWVLELLLVAGVVMRVLTWLAYQPALLYTDSYYYLYNVDSLNPGYLDPIGYPLFVLKPLLPIGGLALVSAVQHLAGLGIAVLMYRIVTRYGVRRWLAALATIPVLLDGYQLQIEQDILTDVWLELLLMVALWLLMRRRVPAPGLVALAGVTLGVAASVRMVAITAIIPAAVFVLLVGRDWRVPGGWRRIGIRAAALAGGFGIVLGGYATYFHSQVGYWGLNTASGNSLYGRTAVVADCAKLDLDSVLSQLCPTEPLGMRLTTDNYAHMDGDPNWPGYVPAGMTKYDLDRMFADRVIQKQPLDVLNAILTDFQKGFAWQRVTLVGDPPVESWQFQTTFPVFSFDPQDTSGTAYQQTDTLARQFGGRGIALNAGLAGFLRTYQLGHGYVPGPFLAWILVIGAVGAVAIPRARRSGLTGPALFAAGTALTVLGTAAVFEFSWRYQLPGLVLIPLAGVLGVGALFGIHRDPTPTEPAD